MPRKVSGDRNKTAPILTCFHFSRARARGPVLQLPGLYVQRVPPAGAATAATAAAMVPPTVVAVVQQLPPATTAAGLGPSVAAAMGAAFEAAAGAVPAAARLRDRLDPGEQLQRVAAAAPERPSRIPRLEADFRQESEYDCDLQTPCNVLCFAVRRSGFSSGITRTSSSGGTTTPTPRRPSPSDPWAGPGRTRSPPIMESKGNI